MKFIKYTIAFLIWATMVVFVLPSDNYYIDLIQSFTFHAMLVYLVVTVIFALMRWKYVAISGFAVSFMLLIHLFPHVNNIFDTGYGAHAHGESFKVAHFNILGSNRHFDEIINNAIQLNADILSFQEVEEEWAHQLMDGLEEEYPYFAITEHKFHGVAIFSKYPLENMKTYYWTDEPTLTGDVIYNGNALHFVATHTLSPRNIERFQVRNQHLGKVAEYVKQVNGPVVAIGDFNAVPWSQVIVNITKNTDLVDSRKGLTSTFPANLPIGIPIDYIFHSDELSCINFEAVDAIGSDHKGVVGEYAFTSPSLLVDIN